MGPPYQKQAEGHTEVWSYASGDGTTNFVSHGSSTTTGSVSGGHLSAQSNGTAFGASSQRFCTVGIVMADGRVDRVNYSGPTGGIITEGEQCAFAVKNCIQ